jgi:prolyl-tRNA editing enzyme YbaK/EbsC (Cys-tRNA(Pro) deacylase)
MNYEEHRHAPTVSAKESAASRAGTEKESVKSLIFKTDKGDFILVLMRGDVRVITKVLKELEGCSDIKLASADEVLRISGVPVGSVGPFGLKTKLKTYFYKGILENTYSWFSAGDSTVSVKIRSKDLLDVLDSPVMLEQ